MARSHENWQPTIKAQILPEDQFLENDPRFESNARFATDPTANRIVLAVSLQVAELRKKFNRSLWGVTVPASVVAGFATQLAFNLASHEIGSSASNQQMKTMAAYMLGFSISYAALFLGVSRRRYGRGLSALRPSATVLNRYFGSRPGLLNGSEAVPEEARRAIITFQRYNETYPSPTPGR